QEGAFHDNEESYEDGGRHSRYHEENRHFKNRRFSKKNFHRREQRSNPIISLDDLINQRKVSLEAISYMRGRSIARHFIFIDEAQNLTTHEIKTLLSRVAAGSKIILSGDPYQIDVPYLDFSTNGLVVAT